MHNYDKAKLLKDRHIAVHIEWGGVEGMFTHASDLSTEGTVEFLRIMQMDDEKVMNELLSALIQEEDGKQQ